MAFAYWTPHVLRLLFSSVVRGFPAFDALLLLTLVFITRYLDRDRGGKMKSEVADERALPERSARRFRGV